MLDEFNIIKRKKKKNAFVSTALLITIAIAVLVIILVVLLMGRKNNNCPENNCNGSSNTTTVTCGNGTTKEEKFNDNLRTIKDAAEHYFTLERMPANVGETKRITLKEMQDAKMVLSVIDSTGSRCNAENSYVEVTKENDEYVMKIYLSCSDMEDYIIVHLGCYDYCKGTICEKQVEPGVTEFEYIKETGCTMSPWSDWGAWQTTREATNENKREETKTETAQKEVIDTKDATMNPVTYNCNKYPGYKLVGTKCVKETTKTDTVDATPSKYSYNCNKYPGYTLSGTKCIKTTTTTDTKPATKVVTYNCDKYPGYQVSGDKCIKTSSSTETRDATVSYSCPSGYTLSGKKCSKSSTSSVDATVSYSCPSGYTRNGTKCYRTTTDTVAATPTYSTRTVSYTCYKQQCTTKTVFSCKNGKCGNYPETSCTQVAKTCYKEEQYHSGYSCPSGYTLNGDKCTKSSTDTRDASVDYSCPSGYTRNGSKCYKTTTDTIDATVNYSCPSGYTRNGSKCSKTTTDTIDATAKYSCPSGYTLSGTKCYKTTAITDTKPATPVTTYNCKNYSGYTLSGTNCIKKITVTDTKDATKVPGGYTCPNGYKLDGKKCTKTTVIRDTKDADHTPITYSCPTGYTLSGTKCTKKVMKEVKTTYYRYSTRTCTGGTSDTKWSTSNNDQSLLNDGYKLTGKTREVSSSSNSNNSNNLPAEK